MKAWMVYAAYDKFARVNKRWKEVLALIIEDKGGNDKVEQCRSKLSKLERLPPIMDAVEMDDDLDSLVSEDDEHLLGEMDTDE